MSEYVIDDSASVALLQQVCATADRLHEIADQIAKDGLMVQTRLGPRPHPLLKDEAAARHFIARGLKQLGLTDAQPRGPGRPAEGFGWRPGN